MEHPIPLNTRHWPQVPVLWGSGWLQNKRLDVDRHSSLEEHLFSFVVDDESMFVVDVDVVGECCTFHSSPSLSTELLSFVLVMDETMELAA